MENMKPLTLRCKVYGKYGTIVAISGRWMRVRLDGEEGRCDDYLKDVVTITG